VALRARAWCFVRSSGITSSPGSASPLSSGEELVVNSPAEIRLKNFQHGSIPDELSS
jgi:hypothetical protein